MLHVMQELTTSKNIEKRLNVIIDMKSAMEKASLCGATLAEANLMSILTDTELQRPGKKRKIDSQMKKLETWSQTFLHDVKGAVHDRILAESMGVLLSLS